MGVSCLPSWKWVSWCIQDFPFSICPQVAARVVGESRQVSKKGIKWGNPPIFGFPTFRLVLFSALISE